MQRIDDWRPVASPKKRATNGSGPPARAPSMSGPQQEPAQLNQEAIFQALETLQPVATHLYCAEGYPWINVVFDEANVIGPSMVEKAGAAIAKGCDPRLIYFHALGVNDVRFLLDIPMEGTKNDAELLAEKYGVALDKLGTAWAEDLRRWTDRKRAIAAAA